jgi:putative addiction module component (TIGR02574 family)
LKNTVWDGVLENQENTVLDGVLEKHVFGKAYDMTVTLEEIKAAVLELSSEERDDLRALLEEFDDRGELSPEWKAEIERRVANYRSGKTQGVPLETAMNEARD